MATRSNIIADVLFFVRNDLLNNITDPLGSRSGSSKFVMTSFPQRNVKYPLITIKMPNMEILRAGMQTTATDMTLTLEVRIWARNEKEKDEIATAVLDRLANIQFSASGSIDNDFHDFNILSAIEMDEEEIKSRILQVQYKFFN